MTSRVERAISHAKNERDRFVSELDGFLRIPSISIDPRHDPDTVEAAIWVANRLKALGATEVRVHKTGKHPIITGEVKSTGGRNEDAAAPTVLMYGHYDVQLPDPIDEWASAPFDPVIRDDEMYARGAVDNKGPIVAAIAAVESLLQAGSLPVNAKFLIEGEEEIGSPSLASFLEKNGDLLSSDISLNGDSGMATVDIPTITYGLRGLIAAELIVRGPTVDLHSGLFGGAVHNPIHALAELLAGMHDERGRITLPGFYDDVVSLDDEERSLLAEIPRDDAGILALSGAPAIWGDEAFTAAERTSARPTLDVLMVQGGAQKSAIPASAMASVSMRLVPNQTSQQAFDQLRSFVEQNAPPTVTWEINLQSVAEPSLFNRNSRWIKAMSEALASAWGKRPLLDRMGGSIPAVSMLKDYLGVDSVLSGLYRPGDNLHAPNEKLHLPTWERMIDTIIHFLSNIGG